VVGFGRFHHQATSFQSTANMQLIVSETQTNAITTLANVLRYKNHVAEIQNVTASCVTVRKVKNMEEADRIALGDIRDTLMIIGEDFTEDDRGDKLREASQLVDEALCGSYDKEPDGATYRKQLMEDELLYLGRS